MARIPELRGVGALQRPPGLVRWRSAKPSSHPLKSIWIPIKSKTFAMKNTMRQPIESRTTSDLDVTKQNKNKYTVMLDAIKHDSDT
eukprot:scaffold155677_cov39-Prasinocladus_malaysianus.AAC.1